MGAPETQARLVNSSTDAGLVMRALGQSALAKFATALRPIKARLARARATGGRASTLALRQLASILSRRRRALLKKGRGVLAGRVVRRGALKESTID